MKIIKKVFQKSNQLQDLALRQKSLSIESQKQLKGGSKKDDGVIDLNDSDL